MTQKIRYTVAIAIFLIIFSPVSAQFEDSDDYTPPLRERLFFGGNFGLQFGTYTYIDISPVIGLWVLPRLSVAVGPSYKFLKDPVGTTDVFGGKGFSRFVIIQDLNSIIPIGYRMSIYAHAEFESLSYRSEFFYTSYERDRFVLNNVLGGVGISQYIGRRSSINMSILWVLNESDIKVYDSPEFRIGFTF